RDLDPLVWALQPSFESSRARCLGEDWTKVPTIFTVVQRPLLPAAVPPIHGVDFSDPQLGHLLLIQLTSALRSDRLTMPVLLGICLCSPAVRIAGPALFNDSRLTWFRQYL